MDKKEKMFLYKKFEKINTEILNIKGLARILEESLLNENGNLTEFDICILSEILTRTACALSNQAQKFEIELGRRLLL